MGLYALSLVLPGYRASGDSYYGFFCLLLGPIGLFGGHFSWIANPLLVFSWMRFTSGAAASALALAVTALLMALTFLFEDKIPVGSSGEFSFEIGMGYWVWLTSVALAVLAAIDSQARVLRKRRADRSAHVSPR